MTFHINTDQSVSIFCLFCCIVIFVEQEGQSYPIVLMENIYFISSSLMNIRFRVWFLITASLLLCLLP